MPDTKPRRKMVEFTGMIYEDQYERVRRIAFEEHVSMAAVVRRALDRHLSPLSAKD